MESETLGRSHVSPEEFIKREFVTLDHHEYNLTFKVTKIAVQPSKYQPISTKSVELEVLRFKRALASVIVDEDSKQSQLSLVVEFRGQALTLTRTDGECNVEQIAWRLSKYHNSRYGKSGLRIVSTRNNGRICDCTLENPDAFLGFLHLIKTAGGLHVHVWSEPGQFGTQQKESFALGSDRQSENVYNFPVPGETAQIPSNLVQVYTNIRKTVRAWQDLSYAGFSDWSRLDEDDPLSVIQIRKTAPDLATLFDRATSLFDEIWSLRNRVTTLIDDEQERLVQEFRPKFDSGSKVNFSFFRITADGGNANTLYLLHAWIRGESLREHAEFAARARYSRMKTWNLEVMVTGQRAGQSVSESVASGEDAVKFGQRVLDYLETQEPARRLRDELKRVPELRGKILPLIERELSKG